MIEKGKQMDKEKNKTTDSVPEKKPKLSHKEKKAALKRRREELLIGNVNEKDIKYRGPLSYRYFRIIAWVSIAITQIGVLAKGAVKIDASHAERYKSIAFNTSIFASLIVPMFLIANFSVVLSNVENYKSQILKFAGLAAAVFCGYMLFYERYVVGLVDAFIGSRKKSKELLGELMQGISRDVGLYFNVFIDLLLFSLLMFFVNYYPKKYFVGKKRKIFRAFAILPIAYELTCIVIKIYSSLGFVKIPVWAFPLMTVKPPMVFLMFLVMVRYIKQREMIFTKHGKTNEEYVEFLNSNTNSWHFSVFTSNVILVGVIADVLITLILTGIFTHAGAVDQYAKMQETAVSAQDMVESWGFGKTLPMLSIIPFMLLFSYTRKHKKTIIDLLVPVAGICLIFIVWFEGLFRIARKLPDYLMNNLNSMDELIGFEDGETGDSDISFDGSDISFDDLDMSFDDLENPDDSDFEIPQDSSY